jgi:phospholysine phosphohistidine inorganic pyrophosphate phosphatase
MSSPDVGAYCFDLDGTLYVRDAAVPGAVAALERLRARGTPFRCLSNTTSRPRAGLLARLAGYGFTVAEHELLTAPLAAAALLRKRGHRTVAPFMPEAALVDLAGFELLGGTAPARPGGGAGAPDAVLIGDLGAAWNDALMQEAFGYLMAGADFIACSRDRYWKRADGLVMDCGAYVAGLEHATGRPAEVAGKPGAPFYQAALESLGGFAPHQVAMVGDDPWSDVAGAQAAGMQGWLVASGKFSPDALGVTGITPDRVLASVAHLPE